MLTNRIMGAIMFKREVYAEVENDTLPVCVYSKC